MELNSLARLLIPQPTNSYRHQLIPSPINKRANLPEYIVGSIYTKEKATKRGILTAIDTHNAAICHIDQFCPSGGVGSKSEFEYKKLTAVYQIILTLYFAR